MVLDDIKSKWYSALMCMASIMRPVTLFELRDIFNKIPQYGYNDVYLFVKEMHGKNVIRIELSSSLYGSTYCLSPQHICSLLKTVGDRDFEIYQTFETSKKNVLNVATLLRNYLLRRPCDYTVADDEDFLVCGYDLVSNFFKYIRRDEEYLNFFAEMPEQILKRMYDEDTTSLHMLGVSRSEAYLERMYFNNIRLNTDDRRECYDKYVLYQNFLIDADIPGSLSKVSDSFYGYLLRAVSFEYSGQYKQSLDLYHSLLKKRPLGILHDAYASFMYVYALIADSSAVSLKRLRTLSTNRKVKDMTTFIPALMMMQITLRGECTDADNYCKVVSCSGNQMVNVLTAFVIKHFSIEIQDTAWLSKIERFIVASGYILFKLEYAQNFPLLYPMREDLVRKTGLHPLFPEYRKPAAWEYVIDSLMTIVSENKMVATGDEQELSRVSYLVNSELFVTPRLQKSKDGGRTWSRGRNIAVSKFKEGVPGMSDFDQRMIAHVKVMERNWNGMVTLGIFGERAIAELAGCPLVFMEENPLLRVDIIEEKPQLIVTKTFSGYHVMSNIGSGEMSKPHIVRVDTPQSYKVIHLNSKQREIFNLFNKVNLFPFESKNRLTAMLELLSKDVTVLSDLLKGTERIDRIAGSSLITVQMRPLNDAISVQLFVKPLDEGTLYCFPAKGMEYIATNLNGVPVQVVRDIPQEKFNNEKVLSVMAAYDDAEDGKRWNLNVVECLHLLDTLREIQQYCCVEWPEGVKYKVSYPAIRPEGLKLSVSGMGQWFEIKGEVKVAENVVMKISDLLQRLHDSNGDFVRLSDTEYVALTEQLRRQLGMLEKLLDTEKKVPRLSSFNVSFLENMVDIGVDMTTDDTYKDLISRIAQSENKDFHIPRNIQADLREYQKEGYYWMAQLAEWGAGACLADDMGLGKTLQAITILLSRADKGPSLVIAPASLLFNWQEEILKFAPSLNTYNLNKAGDDRKTVVDHAGKYDVVVTTYGLLVTEEALVISRSWNVIVLDEAHTIKNRETKMSKAAMNLRGDFRLILTGTPLQNHLSEIWNLFRFVNPGLLGSFAQFTDRFIIPIEKNRDKGQQKLLNRVISPFILRRTKSEVLSELPEKTEITINVELSDDEWALYDNIRRQTLTNLEEGRSTTIQALAEITHLRQAACHPALIDKSLQISSSKSEAFMNMVDELVSNNHRALVFSQFTSHLSLIRQELDRAGIRYLYLDGSIAPSRRTLLVQAFQEGDMPLFLISLKAGGLGLNLTAADYIIHLDPWWNPAIEDQASDRAYRIGQKRPVTVYRLISKNTIEEKIINLHKTKKDLADALLDGSDMTQKMGRDEIISMLKEKL